MNSGDTAIACPPKYTYYINLKAKLLLESVDTELDKAQRHIGVTLCLAW